MHVLVPYNGGTKYIVTTKDSPGKFLIWNANQIKDFIPSLQIMKGLKESVTSEPKDSAVQKIQLALNNPDSLEFDGNIIESRLKEKNLTAKQREVLRRAKSTWDISQIGTLPGMVNLGLSNGSINEDVQIFLTCTSLTYNEFLNIYKIIVVDNHSNYQITARGLQSNQDTRFSYGFESRYYVPPAAKVVGVFLLINYLKV